MSWRPGMPGYYRSPSWSKVFLLRRKLPKVWIESTDHRNLRQCRNLPAKERKEGCLKPRTSAPHSRKFSIFRFNESHCECPPKWCTFVLSFVSAFSPYCLATFLVSLQIFCPAISLLFFLECGRHALLCTATTAVLILLFFGGVAELSASERFYISD